MAVYSYSCRLMIMLFIQYAVHTYGANSLMYDCISINRVFSFFVSIATATEGPGASSGTVKWTVTA